MLKICPYKVIVYCCFVVVVIGYKCLQLFDELLSHAPSGSIFSTYIINSLHNMTASEVLLDSISVAMVTVQSQREDSKLYEMLLSRIKLTCEVIILLLNKENTNNSTSLQQLLTGHGKSSHSITLHIVSLIHFSCDPQLPCVATRMLKQLCEVCTLYCSLCVCVCVCVYCVYCMYCVYCVYVCVLCVCVY